MVIEWCTGKFPAFKSRVDRGRLDKALLLSKQSMALAVLVKKRWASTHGCEQIKKVRRIRSRPKERVDGNAKY